MARNVTRLLVIFLHCYILILSRSPFFFMYSTCTHRMPLPTTFSLCLCLSRSCFPCLCKYRLSMDCLRMIFQVTIIHEWPCMLASTGAVSVVIVSSTVELHGTYEKVYHGEILEFCAAVMFKCCCSQSVESHVFRTQLFVWVYCEQFFIKIP